MDTAETRDTVYSYERASRLPEAPRPLCPQFRPCHLERLYPVRGHCFLSHSPGWFMIPSIEEYGRYCTRTEFAACEWFRAGDARTAGAPDSPDESPIPEGGSLR